MQRVTVYGSVLSGVVVAAGWAAPLSAETREPIGATLSVINVVTAEFNRDTRTLQTGDDVRQNELIDVSQDASTELKLNDDTKLALGPGAKLLLDKFVYDGEKSAGAIGVDLVQGAFRFITGVAAKPSYVIKVPSASITVRGTIFDVYVADDDTSWVLLHEGAVLICNARGQCQDHVEPGKLIRVSDKGDVGAPVRWAGLDGSDGLDFDLAFPFVVKPPTIDPTPILTRDDIMRQAAIEPEKAPSKKKSAKRETKAPEKKKPTRSTKREDPPAAKSKSKSKPTKVVSPQPTKKANNDAAAAAAVGIAVGIGLGVGLGKIGKGGGKKHPKPPTHERGPGYGKRY